MRKWLQTLAFFFFTCSRDKIYRQKYFFQSILRPGSSLSFVTTTTR